MNEYVKTFESFVNEGKNFGDITDAIGGDDRKLFNSFFRTAKIGDTFEYAPNGVELDYLSRESFMTQGDVDLEIKQTARGTEPVQCTVVGKGIKVSLHGGSFDFDGEENDTIYFNMGNDKKTIYVLTDTY